MSEIRGTVVYRNHHSTSLWPELGRLHTPYRDILHDPETDDQLAQANEPLRGMLRELGAEDGDELEIVVRKTGNRPFEGTIWALTEAHKYERVDAETYAGPDYKRGDV